MGTGVVADIPILKTVPRLTLKQFSDELDKIQHKSTLQKIESIEFLENKKLEDEAGTSDAASAGSHSVCFKQ